MRKKEKEKNRSVKNEGLKRKKKKKYLLSRGPKYRENTKRNRTKGGGERRRYGI